MIKASKIRLKPTIHQQQIMWQSVGTARFIYNWTLNKQEENYKNGGKFISNNDLRKEITRLKKTTEYNWLNDISNNVAKQAVKDACDAYQRFFKGLAEKPKFKTRKKSKSSFYNDTSKIRVKHMKVLIEKIGWIKTAEQVPMSVKYTNPRVIFDGKYWYIAVGVEIENPIIELSDESIGIDVGIKDLAVCSNEMVFKNINKTPKVRKLKKKLKRLQKQILRKYENNKREAGQNRYQFVKSNNMKKLEKEIRLVHRRLNGIRNNHLHQASSAIVKTKPSRIVMETINIKEIMKNKHLSKAIKEQSLYEFKRQIEYKCKFYGIEFVEADRSFPSSKLCSCCGSIKKDLKFSHRIYKCDCGNIIDRDFQASINLSRYKLA